tara:strand:- start:176 stop:616 length:441 start_codon:yes stop_codon:yes gene_type:complete
MKLTKNKLEQLILQEMEYYRPPEFDSRSRKNYPEYEEKLKNLYMSDDGRDQARELAGALEEPIDIPVDASRTEDDLTLPIFDKSKHKFFGVRVDKDGVELNFRWNPQQQKYQVSYQLPWDIGDGAGQVGFSYFEDYEKAKEMYYRN